VGEKNRTSFAEELSRLAWYIAELKKTERTERGRLDIGGVVAVVGNMYVKHRSMVLT